jgi:hypothetical protein
MRFLPSLLFGLDVILIFAGLFFCVTRLFLWLFDAALPLRLTFAFTLRLFVIEL